MTLNGESEVLLLPVLEFLDGMGMLRLRATPRGKDVRELGRGGDMLALDLTCIAVRCTGVALLSTTVEVLLPVDINSLEDFDRSSSSHKLSELALMLLVTLPKFFMLVGILRFRLTPRSRPLVLRVRLL